MKFTAAYIPVSPSSPTASILAWGLAVTFVLLATGQLILYEKFVPFMQSFNIFDNPSLGEAFAACMVITEVMAIPFLLRMNLSPLLRLVSACCVLLSGLFLLFLGYWSIIRPFNSEENMVEVAFSHSNGAIMPFGIVVLAAGCIALFLLRRDLKS